MVTVIGWLACAAAVAAGLGVWLQWHAHRMHRRLLARVQGRGAQPGAARPVPVGQRLSGMLTRLGDWPVHRFCSRELQTRIAELLVRAGLPPELTAAAFTALRVILAVTGAGVGALLHLIGLGSLAATGLLAAAGYWLPLSWLETAARRRRAEIVRELPDLLDVLGAGLTAGAGVDYALRLVGERLPGPLAGEIRRCWSELDLGVPRREALQGLARRCGTPEVEWLVQVLVDGLQLGVPLTQELAAHARDLRLARRHRAREEAARNAPLITLVTATVLVPGILLLVLGLAGLNLWLHPERFGLANLVGG